MQWLAKISVMRPVFAAVLILSLTVLGLFAIPTLSVERYPNVDIPYVTVATAMPGASPEEIESEVTEIIERNVGSVPGILSITSQSMESLSLVTVEFVIEKNGDTAAQEVRASIDAAIAELPQTAERPIVQKFRTDDVPIVSFTLASPHASLRELTEYGRRTLRPQLEGIKGVGQVAIVGGREREIQVRMDPERLRAFELTPVEVQRAISAQNLLVPGGAITQGTTRLSVQTEGRVTDLEQLRAIVIRKAAGRAIRLSDIATVLDGEKEATALTRVNGEPAILLDVRKQSGENTVAVVDAVRQRLQDIAPGMPSGYKTEVVRDESVFVRASVKDVQNHLVLGAILASFVVLIFLRDWRSTIIAAIAIPTSIIATFALMKVQGFTINVLTLLALTLAVGIVIDDAIIVLENIVRYLKEKTSDRKVAAVQATNEIGLAVLATTLSLVAVFLPVAFISGITGRFLASFALTMSFAILVSLLVAFSVTPMLGAVFLKAGTQNEEREKSEHMEGDTITPALHPVDWLTGLENVYAQVLRWSLRNRRVIVVVSLLTFFSTVPLAMIAKTGFLPSEDLSLFTVSVRLPEGTAVAETERILTGMAKELQTLPEVRTTVVTAGDLNTPNKGGVLVKMNEIPERKTEITTFELMERVQKEIVPKYPKNWIVTVASTDSFAESSAAVQFVLTGPDSNVLVRTAETIAAELKKSPEVASATTNAYPGKPQLKVRIDRERAAEFGVSVADIATTVRLLVEGEKVSRYSEKGRQYDIRVLADTSYRNDPAALTRYLVPATVAPAVGEEATGVTGVPLSEVLQFAPESSLAEINRYGRQREARVLVVPKPTASLGGLQEIAERTYKAQKLPAEYQFVAEGDAEETEKTFAAFGAAFLLSITFMYLILAAQFESWVHPVTILLSLPLCVPFALLPIVVTGDSLNLFSLLGILVLFGIVKKNSILQVDHANQLRAAGLERTEALIQSSRDRLRPILMTTIAFVAGMIPLAFSHEAGVATNRSISVVVIGGQTLSLALTLIATPVFYSLFDDLTTWLAKLRKKQQTAVAATTRGAIVFLLMVLPALVPSVKAQGTTALAGDAEVPVVRSVEEAVQIALARNAQPRIAAEQTRRTRETTAQLRAALRPQTFVSATYTRLSDPNAFGSTGLTATGNTPLPGGALGIGGLMPPGTTSVTLPNDSAAFTRSRQSGDPTGEEPPPFDPSAFQNTVDLNVTTLQFGISLPMDVTGSLGVGVRIGKQDEELARLQEEQVRQELALSVRLACYQLLQAQANVIVQEAAVARATEQVRITSERRREGLVPEYDLLRARTEEKAAQQAAINARNQVTIAGSALRNLLNVPSETQIALSIPELPPIPALDTAALLAKATTERPEAKLVALSIARAGNSVRYARRGLEPQLGLSLSGVYNANQAGFGFGTKRANGSVSVAVTLPLDDGGTTRAAIRSARSEKREAEIRQEQFLRGITAEVEQSATAVYDAYARLTVATAAIAEAKAALDIAQLRFSSGIGTQLEVLDSQAALTRAEANQATARFEAFSSLARFHRALGIF